ncbi:MAG: tRNA (adenosine(37)-N6)-threonylcarbamoyltransferase complex ATPase subunit type 1 TsaE [Candidatus Levybacteria bacterium]|nr:tRNA (adenosine(37)-N6)-threonylcarbamoyltransferase complex ATPase subunit type 1 TsaE [Candidatus Levybacteria bacterium]
MRVITKSSEETRKIAETLAKQLASKGLNPFRGSTPTKALVIALYGELGSGKTTFVQGLARGLGIKRRIISPTFIIVRSYKIKNQKSKIKIIDQSSKIFYHTDLYRIQSVKDLEGLGLGEIINNQNNIVVIEWAEKIAELLPKNRMDIEFEYVDENRRKITIKRLSS